MCTENAGRLDERFRRLHANGIGPDKRVYRTCGVLVRQMSHGPTNRALATGPPRKSGPMITSEVPTNRPEHGKLNPNRLDK